MKSLLFTRLWFSTMFTSVKWLLFRIKSCFFPLFIIFFPQRSFKSPGVRDNGPCGGRKPRSQAGKCGSKEAIDEVSISASPQWEPTAVAKGSIQQIITISTTSAGRSVGCEHAPLSASRLH